MRSHPFPLPSQRKSYRYTLLLLAFALLLSLSASAHALGARKVTSLDPETYGSSPSDFCQLGETLYFRASDGYHGYELWKMDGPGAPPVMVADINPGGSSGPNELVCAGERLLFFADDGNNGLQLWTSDGTEDGTTPVTSVVSGFAAAGTMTAAEDRLFFFTEEDSYGWQLWTSDGTQAGTFAVTELTSSEMVPIPLRRELCVVGNMAYFVAYDESHGYELWVSDGTMDGTNLVCDLVEGTEGHYPRILTAVGTSLAFCADDGTNGYQVYRLDEGSSDPLRVTSFDNFGHGTLYADTDGSLVIFPWDYGAEETVEIWELEPSSAPADLVDTVTVAGADAIRALEPMGRLNGDLVFPLLALRTDDDTLDLDITTELWGLDEEGAHLIVSLGAVEVYSEGSAIFEGVAYFIAWDYSIGQSRLWKTDGTAEGTTALTGTEEGISVGDIQVFGTTLALAAQDPHHRTELWISDGTAEGTHLHADINLQTAGEKLVWNDRIYMGGWDDSGPGLRVSDGTASGTEMLVSTPPTAGYCPQYFFDGEERFYFLAGGNREGVRLWTSDGTAEGTVELADLGPERGISSERALQELDGKRYFVRHEEHDFYRVTSPELWETDGTPEGTVFVSALAGEDSFNMNLARAGDGLVLDVYDYETEKAALWASDGTAGGTMPLSVDLGESRVYEMVTVESGDAYFLLRNSSGDFMLWKTDGTDEGTAQIALIGTEGAVAAADLTPCGNRVFFLVFDYTTREIQLWVTEGTEETTHQVADINPDGGDDVGRLTAFGEQVFFAADDGIHGRELWTSDGTEEGTVMLADLDPEGSSNPTDLTVLGTTPAFEATASDSTDPGARLYLTADDGSHGRELWSTTGTSDDIVMVTRTRAGDTPPQNPFLLNGGLFFTAVDGEGEINLMRVVEGSSGCNGLGLPALGMMLLPLLMLFKK